MKMLTQLATLAVIIAIGCFGIGTWIVVASKTIGLVTPNALLRLADTALLFAITLILLATAKTKE